MRQGVRTLMQWVGVSALLLGLFSQPAWAARTQIHEAAESANYGTKFGGMIGRGLLNASTCFVDIVVNTVEETKNGPPFVGTLTGVAKGTGCGVLRLASGGVDLLTFWVPGFNGIPVSDSYANCLALPEGSAFLPEQTTQDDSVWSGAMPTSGEPTQVSQSSPSSTSEQPPKWKK